MLCHGIAAEHHAMRSIEEINHISFHGINLTMLRHTMPCHAMLCSTYAMVALSVSSHTFAMLLRYAHMLRYGTPYIIIMVALRKHHNSLAMA
jgi:hypothetical protein